VIPEDSPGWRRGRLAAIAALAVILFLPSVWNRDLWDPDEPGYAEATRQMEVHGDWLVPHFNGGIYSEKPPLFFWLSLIAGKIPGVPAGSGGRLVGALASAGTLLLTWRIGALLMGEATGTLAAFLLSGCILFWNLAQSGVIDPLLAFLTTLAVYGFARHLRAMKKGMVVFYGAAGLAILAKGPVGLIVPALAAIACRLLSAGPGGLRARHPLWGLPLAAAPAGLWLALAAKRAGPEYLHTMLFTQNVGRAVNAYVHHEPVWYYLMVLPLALLPLTLFIPHAMVAAWREKICGIRPVLLPLAWFATTFIFFTVVSSKKTRYMLVLAPAAALLVAGWLMRRFFESNGRIREGRTLVMATAVLLAAVGAALAFPAIAGTSVLPADALLALSEPGSEDALAALSGVLRWPSSLRILVPASILLIAGLWACRLALHRRSEALTALLAGWLVCLAVAGAAWPPVLDPVKSARPLAAMVREHLPEGPLYLLDDNHPPGLNFYLPADALPVLLRKEERIAASQIPGAAFMGRRELMERVEEKVGIRFFDRHCRRVGATGFCIASARPPVAPMAGGADPGDR
jgi:4-amino-4-deoxy-L-arabinose transferase-like glycosyltransferase